MSRKLVALLLASAAHAALAEAYRPLPRLSEKRLKQRAADAARIDQATAPGKAPPEVLEPPEPIEPAGVTDAPLLRAAGQPRPAAVAPAPPATRARTAVPPSPAAPEMAPIVLLPGSRSPRPVAPVPSTTVTPVIGPPPPPAAPPRLAEERRRGRRRPQDVVHVITLPSGDAGQEFGPPTAEVVCVPDAVAVAQPTTPAAAPDPDVASASAGSGPNEVPTPSPVAVATVEMPAPAVLEPAAAEDGAPGAPDPSVTPAPSAELPLEGASGRTTVAFVALTVEDLAILGEVRLPGGRLVQFVRDASGQVLELVRDRGGNLVSARGIGR